jgi:hypothetical protein
LIEDEETGMKMKTRDDSADPRYSVYLLSWYKRVEVQILTLVAHPSDHGIDTGQPCLLVQKYLLYWYKNIDAKGAGSSSVSSDHGIDTGQSFSAVLHEDDEELDDLDINPLLG